VNRYATVIFALATCTFLALPPAYTQKDGTKPAATPQNAAQIELLETKYRFEANGDSRKEVHARVRINNELGVQQFARLKFDYNRSFQSVEIPLVRVSHPSGGTADILPSAIADNPNPAVLDFPAYQDIREKSVRILGLAPGDLLEYRVVTTTTHPPLAPDFWLDHTFDRTGVVSEENFQLDFPSSAKVQVRISPATPAESKESAHGRIVYKWQLSERSAKQAPDQHSEPDVAITTFSSWEQLADRLASLLIPSEQEVRALHDQAAALTNADADSRQKASAIYDFVSKKIRTVDLPLGATGFRTRKSSEILASGYGTAEDKFFLFASLANNFFGPARAGLVSESSLGESALPSPAHFDHLLTMSGRPSINFWMDLNIEVAPFLMIPSQFSKRPAFVVGPAVANRWETAVSSFPVPSTQDVTVTAEIGRDGTLSAKVHYRMRGDNELLLRVAFHQTPKEKWKDVAQLLALSDGFRGKVTNVTASDPYDTKDPFQVEYEVEQPKFVNWEKKPVRIPAILPLLGLPDPPPAGSKADIDLGTPLDVNLHAALKLPPGTTARVPTGTSVARDYAEFSSSYSAQGETLTASRKIRFLLRTLPADRAMDYNAFLRAVQNDQAQEFTLERHEPEPKTESAKLAHHAH
jgi:hypothetical protein